MSKKQHYAVFENQFELQTRLFTEIQYQNIIKILKCL